MFLPPILRRLFSASPIVAPLLLALTVITLFVGFSGVHQHVVPTAWVGGPGVGGAVQAGAVAANNNGAGIPTPAPPDDDDDNRLPPAYAAYFSDLQLPTELASVPVLGARLRAFLRRPVQTYAEAREGNDAHCPAALADRLVNPDQLRNEGAWWEALAAGEVVRRRAQLVGALADVVRGGGSVVGEEGTRGIVMTAGNKDTTVRLLATLRVLRKLDVDLPVEVFHYPDEQVNDGQRQEIEELGGTLVEATGVTKTPGQWKNWQIKPLALIQSSFSEILYLDSDNMPLRSPVHLFDAPNYVAGGRAAFWPDLSKDHAKNAVWRVMGEACTLAEWTFESGQLVVSKAGNQGLNLAALHIAAAMMADDAGSPHSGNGDDDDDAAHLSARGFWLKMCGGDKDAFRWAFRALDIGYVPAPRWMSALGFLNGADGRFCGHTTLQHDLVTPTGYTAPPPLFVHANLLKHLGGGGGFGTGPGRQRLFSHVKRMALDDAGITSLNYARMTVYTGPRNMCLDLGVEDSAEAAQGLGENKVETVEVADLEGNPFDGFEDLFFAAGGKVGGW